jgi:phosphoglycolate phosphatase
MYDCFVFDLDGTLLNTLADLADSTNDVLRRCGYPEHTQEEIRSFVGHGAERLIFQAVPKSATAEEAEAALEMWKRHYPEQGYPKTKPYDGIAEALRTLRGRGAALGVLSNKFDGAAKSNIERFLPGCFDAVHGERVGVPRKPNPRALLLMVDELESVPERTVYVGDSPVDMEVANNAGVFALGVAWGFNDVETLRRAGADAIAATPFDLPCAAWDGSFSC